MTDVQPFDPPIQICLFDVDGCLVDSSRPILEAMNTTMATFGLGTMGEDEYTRYIGPPLLTSLELILDSRGADPARASEMVGQYQSDYEAIALDAVATFDGVPELLAELAGKVRLAVVTSKPGALASPLLAKLDLVGYFEFIEGPGLDESERKPETLARALDRIHSTPRESIVMIGDRKYDTEAAHANRVRSLGVTWGFGSYLELTEAGADAVVSEPAQVLEYVL